MENNEKTMVQEGLATQFVNQNLIARFVPPPPRGYIKELASEFSVSERTVQLALQDKASIRNSLIIRKRYMEKYVQPYL